MMTATTATTSPVCPTWAWSPTGCGADAGITPGRRHRPRSCTTTSRRSCSCSSRSSASAGAGEAKDFATVERLSLGGELPINTSGGLLGEAYIHGMNGIAECVRQIRGTSVNQVPDVEHVLVTAGHRRADERPDPARTLRPAPGRPVTWSHGGATTAGPSPSSGVLHDRSHRARARHPVVGRHRRARHRRRRRLLHRPVRVGDRGHGRGGRALHDVHAAREARRRDRSGDEPGPAGVDHVHHGRVGRRHRGEDHRRRRHRWSRRRWT